MIPEPLHPAVVHFPLVLATGPLPRMDFERHRLLELGIRPTDVTHVFLSHHHYDHMGDYPRLLLTRWDANLTTLAADDTSGSVVDYASGVDIANTIILQSNTTQLQVLTGTATQSGSVLEDAPFGLWQQNVVVGLWTGLAAAILAAGIADGPFAGALRQLRESELLC